MIALASGLPLLQIGDRAVTEYTPQWLEQSILTAAADAGHDKWWFASDIVRSLFLYLRDRFDPSVITLQELFEKIRLTLEVLGFQDIAKRLHEQPPPMHISLLSLAKRSMHGGYELEFFEYLAFELQEACLTGTTDFRVSDLRPAVKALCGASRWRRDCDLMANDIVVFIQRHLPQDAACSKLQIC